MALTKADQMLETDRRIAQCLGLGMSIEKTSKYLDLHLNTVRNHMDSNGPFIYKIKSEIEALLAVQTAHTVTAVKAKAEDRIQDVLTRGLTLTERAIKKAEDLGDQATLPQLMAIHNNIVVWASRFFVSEAPKHVKVAAEVEHHHTISGEALDRLEALERMLIPAPRALPVIDVSSRPAECD